MPVRNLEMLHEVAAGFGDQLSRVVFVGSAILDLYADDPAAPENRPAKDIDCVIRAEALLDVLNWEKFLVQRGFVREFPEERIPVRWLYKGISVHLIPGTPDLAGFSNRWYEEAVFHAQTRQISPELRIRLFSPAYYLATKMEAFRNRGRRSFRLSSDFADMVYLLAWRKDILTDIDQAFYGVRDYIRSQIRAFLAETGIREGLYQMMPFEDGEEEVARVTAIFRAVSGTQMKLAG